MEDINVKSEGFFFPIKLSKLQLFYADVYLL